MNLKNVEALRVALVVATTDKLGPVFTDEFYDRVAAVRASRGVLVPSTLKPPDFVTPAGEVPRSDEDVLRFISVGNLRQVLDRIAKSESGCWGPPSGWSCSRVAGHDGPCAARPVPC